MVAHVKDLARLTLSCPAEPASRLDIATVVWMLKGLALMGVRR